MLPLLALLVVAAAPAEPPRPRLAVVVVIDQLSARDFDARAEKTKGGIKRLLSEGFRVREGHYRAAPTLTSVGHATIVTGAMAETHGIVANQWWDESEGKLVLSTEDPKYLTLGREQKDHDCTSPKWLRADTLGDALKSRFPTAKVATVAGKDRAAILMGGASADLALWLDTESPTFTSSTYYAMALPEWVNAVNATLLKTIPPAPALAGRHGDSEPLVERIEIQAAIDRAQIDLALAEVDQLKLGQDDVPDLLAVSFSGHDRIGHAVGPEAKEAVDEFLTIDAELGRLFDGLDKRVGKGRYVVALTSDHGVGQTAEVMQSRHIDSGRVDGKGLLKELQKEAEAALGKGDWFTGYWTPGFSIAPANRAKVLSVIERLRAVARKVPGVIDLVDATKVCGLSTPMASYWCHGNFPGRSPDLILLTRPYWLYGKSDVAGHASAYSYDRIVPMIFSGPGVKKGVIAEADVVSLAPTLAAMLGAPRPAASYAPVISEALSVVR